MLSWIGNVGGRRVSEAKRKAEALATWFDKSARPVLEKWAADRVSTFTEDFARLRDLSTAHDGRVSACVLGAAGVGKSTLLNALVAGKDAILPAGGIGPLTAQETRVAFAEVPSFRVEYLARGKLWNVAFSLERRHEADLRRAGGAIAAAGGDLGAQLSEDDREKAGARLEAEDGETWFAAQQRQAQLLIKGQQFLAEQVPLTYLLDALRLSMGMAPRWGTTIDPADLPRIDGIRKVFAIAGSKEPVHERRADGDARAFRRDLHDHAAGYLAPLIKKLEVKWNSDLLRSGLVLVDLPGVGVANDEYIDITKQAMRQARCIILVVDRAGVTTESAELLKDTGFLVSLLHEASDPTAEPLTLIVSVVKLDLSADDAYRQDREQNPDSYRKWVEHLEEAYARSVEMVRAQLRAELEKIALEGSEASLGDRRAVTERLLNSLLVHPVLAREYRSLVADDPEFPPRIKDERHSRIPQFRDALSLVANQRRERIQQRLADSTAALRSRSIAALEIIQAQWKENTRALAEIQQLKIDLEGVTRPLDGEFRVRQGAFREFLREGLPALIEALVGEAVAGANADIQRHLRKYEEYHWATLRAAVTKGGAFVGARRVDLPNELTARLEEPIAIVWDKQILTDLRKRTTALGNDYVEMVGEIVSWARAQGARVQPKLAEALHEELKANAKELATVGKEEISKLRDRVREQLNAKIEERVRKGCEEFCRENRHIGRGVRVRMLDFFSQELTSGVIKAARPVAIRVLKENYEAVKQEIEKLVRKYANPIEIARHSILESHEERLMKAGTQQRQKVLDDVGQALELAPRA